MGLALRAGFRRAAQQYALLRVWERSGPDAVRTLLDAPAAAAWLSRAVVTDVENDPNKPDVSVHG